MKNIFKRILIFSITLLLSISNINGIKIVNAVTVHKINADIEIYGVNGKVESMSSSIVDLYNNDTNNLEFEDYKKEQARLEMENYRIEKAKKQRIEFKTKIVNFAKQFVGNPYVSGGTSLTNGADCSGFVQTIYKTFGIMLTRTTPEQAVLGVGVTMDEIEVGDIVSYGYDGMATHSAIYIGEGKIIHSSTPELGIRIDNINIMPILTIRRVA